MNLCDKSNWLRRQWNMVESANNFHIRKQWMELGWNSAFEIFLFTEEVRVCLAMF